MFLEGLFLIYDSFVFIFGSAFFFLCAGLAEWLGGCLQGSSTEVRVLHPAFGFLVVLMRISFIYRGL